MVWKTAESINLLDGAGKLNQAEPIYFYVLAKRYGIVVGVYKINGDGRKK